MGCSQSRRLDAATRPVACILGRVVGALYCTLERGTHGGVYRESHCSKSARMTEMRT